jgi:hypothetical protein
MQDNTNYSFLVWDNTSKVPFTNNVKELIKNVKWDDQDWQVFGLPLTLAKYYILDGKVLYLQETPDGTAVTEKQNFTGDTIIGTYFLNDDLDGDNYFISFTVTFLKGEIVDIQLFAEEKQSVLEFKKIVDFQENKAKKRLKRQSSYWYRFLYFPYCFIIQSIAFILIIILNGLEFIIRKITKLLTPK